MNEMTGGRGGSDGRSLLPWSFRLPAAGRLMVTALSAVLAALIGAVAHRMGVQWGIPYGLVLSFLLLGVSTWLARARDGGIGVGLHLLVSGMMTVAITEMATGDRALIIFGYNTDTYPFLVQKAGIVWLLGMVAVQVVMLVLPRRWFRVPPRTTVATGSANRGSSSDAG